MGFAPGRRAISVLARYAERDDRAPRALPGYCRKHPCFDGTARRERSPAPRPLSRHKAGAARRSIAGPDAPGLCSRHAPVPRDTIAKALDERIDDIRVPDPAI